MKVNIKIDGTLKPTYKPDRRTHLRYHGDPRTERALAGVLRAVQAIITTSMTGTHFYSRDIGDEELISFLSRKNTLAASLLDQMVEADRTSFHVRPEQGFLILRINVTHVKHIIWSVEMKFRAGGFTHDGFLEQIKFERTN